MGLHAVFRFWDETVGKEVAQHAQPHVIRGTVLWVKVSDSIWMQQLHLQKSILLEKINRRLKNDTLSDMRFQLNASLNKEQEVARQNPNISSQGQGPDPKQLQEFDRMVSSLSDKEVGKELKKLWLKFNSK